MDFGKIFMRQRRYTFGQFLCDRIQGAERFATHPRHFPSQVSPGPTTATTQISLAHPFANMTKSSGDKVVRRPQLIFNLRLHFGALVIHKNFSHEMMASKFVGYVLVYKKALN